MTQRIVFKEVINIPQEEWLPVGGYEKYYMVSNMGRIKNKKYVSTQGHLMQERIMKQSKGKQGYMRISFLDGRCRFVHVLVAKAFVENPDNKPQVNHIYGVKTDNRASQLEWATRKEDSQHALKTGLFRQIGDRCHFAKLKNTDVIEIYKSELKAKVLADKFNVCSATIYQIKRKFR